MDAAIAANATIGLMEPAMNGIGGDLFVIYYEAKTGKTTGSIPADGRLGTDGRVPEVERPYANASERHL